MIGYAAGDECIQVALTPVRAGHQLTRHATVNSMRRESKVAHLELKKNDVVRVRSGGPDITVKEVGERAMIGGQAVFCVWFEEVDRQKVVKRDFFPPEVVDLAGTSGRPIGRIVRE